MEERLSWREQIQKHPYIATGFIVVLLVLIVFIFSAYLFDWSGTGFLNKTLWDWLQLLIIPLALAVIALVFQLANSRTERQIAKERYERDQHIALDKQREDLLQTYLDRLSELLLEKDLRLSPLNAEVRKVARVRTTTILFQLDARRIGYVFTFLREAGLMSIKSNDNIVSLSQADLRKVNFSGADLWEANLGGAILDSANLSGANLREADLSKADLRDANLSRADLNRANLSDAYLNRTNLNGANFNGANFIGSQLSEANLQEAELFRANLRETDLIKTNLNGANLSGADLSGANLREADLSKTNLGSANLNGVILFGANLSEADLSGAIVTDEELKTATSLKGATMPDGSIHP